ncbi:MAG: CPBP family intramembrane metalloprotease [Rhodobacteraceae bacterium CG17_big_fil_post_rev_8_21_14_2_50_65_11]|nr:MAG: CPBP family intramembrane metalloprotease [Rhodobacteraceae bacterium CG17_big_fil_post_rev_8_21_14_2_50_65_11]
MRYKAHDTFIAPAHARPQIWRLVLGILLICAVAVLWIIALFALVYLMAGVEGGPDWIARMSRADTPTSALLVIATLWGLGVGTLLVTPLLHKRSAWTLFGPLRPMRRQFLLAALVAAVLMAASALIPYSFQARPGLDHGLWLSFLPLSLVIILGQTGAEELFFRGYLQQQLAARFNTPLVWMLLPALLFGMAHYDPSSGSLVSWLIVSATGLFGLLAADLTARTGSIGAAWGFHFANNIAAILVLSMGGTLSGLALYTAPIGLTDASTFIPLLLRDMATTVVIWAAIRWTLTRHRS